MNEKLIHQIKKENSIEQVKNELKFSIFPNVLYGASKAAEYIYDELYGDSISIDAVAVDKVYLKDNQTFFKNTQIIASEHITKKYNNVNLIIGFYVNDLSIIRNKINNLELLGLKINKVYMLDFSLIVSPERIFSYEFVQENIDSFEWVYDNLDDQLSKDVLIAFLNQRINMQLGYLDKVREDNQYFTDSLIRFNSNEVFVDCGAYNGDTIELFLNALKKQDISTYDAIYALEPDPENYKQLQKKYSNLYRTYLFNTGVWNKEEVLWFNSGEEMMSAFNEKGNVKVNVTSIDKVLNGSRASFIKMDIQGAEYKALLGAEETLKIFSPKLAICVYHKKEDLIKIPHYIKSINPHYKLFLRAHEVKAAEVVLYAIPN